MDATSAGSLPVGSTHLGVGRAGSARPVLGERLTQEEQVEHPQNRRIESRLRVLQRHGSEERGQVLEPVQPFLFAQAYRGGLRQRSLGRGNVAAPSLTEFLRE